jgi:hypothetical protein
MLSQTHEGRVRNGSPIQNKKQGMKATELHPNNMNREGEFSLRRL